VMLDNDLRQVVRTLNQRGNGIKAIAKTLGISRNTVRRILRTSTESHSAGPYVPDAAMGAPRLELIVRLLFKECQGSALIIAERLAKDYQIAMGYSTLTRYLRALGLRQPRRGRSVHPEIITGPGVEMQFDTSPIRVPLGRETVLLYLANLICGFSRHRYAEFFPRWSRFHAKVFLVRALRSLGGVPEKMSIDNGREIVILGSGESAVIASEMERFAAQIGFTFVPVEAGHKDRQGKIEKAHQYVQTNFLKKYRASNLTDLNAKLATWCRDVFHNQVRGQTFAPADRWEEECAHLKPLPLHIPEPSVTMKARVDDRGRVWRHASSYRVPDRFVLKWLTIRETGGEIIVMDGREEVCRHARIPECERRHSPLAGHREQKTKRVPRGRPSAEEIHLKSLGPEVSRYLEALECRPIRTSYARLRRLYRFSCEYPSEIFLSTMADALVRRAFDLNLLEQVLEEKMGHRIRVASLADHPELEARPAYRKGQVTPHRLQPEPSEEPAGSGEGDNNLGVEAVDLASDRDEEEPS